MTFNEGARTITFFILHFIKHNDKYLSLEGIDVFAEKFQAPCLGYKIESYE